MTTERALGEEQDTQEGQVGAEPGTEWEQNNEEQLFGKSETTPAPDEAPEGKSEQVDEIPLETVQAHPAFADLQGRYDRQGNVLKFQGQQINQLTEQLNVFRTKQTSELLEQLGGDTPENRATVERITKGEELYGQAMAIIQQFGPVLKKEKATEILAQETLPEEYLPELINCETYEEAVQKAKVIKSVLARMPKQTPAPKQSGTPPPKPTKPALSHAPDKAQGSVAPQDFAQAEESYISGKISYQEYKKAADKAGVKLS